MWWAIVGLLIAVPLLLRRVLGSARALTAAPATGALPPSATTLGQRLVDVDAAIDGVRALCGLVPPPAVQACAAYALLRFPLLMTDDAQASHRELTLPTARLTQRAASRYVPFSEDSSVPAGPGTARFTALLAALSAISESDLRDLSDAGLQPSQVVAALSAQLPPERWLEDVLSRLNFWQQTAGALRTRRYG